MAICLRVNQTSYSGATAPVSHRIPYFSLDLSRLPTYLFICKFCVDFIIFTSVSRYYSLGVQLVNNLIDVGRSLPGGGCGSLHENYSFTSDIPIPELLEVL